MTNKKEQTGVEWYHQQIVDRQNGNGDSRTLDELFEQAKEMEKEQIMNAFVECWKENMPEGYECKQSAEYYYNKTYGDEQQ